MIRRLMSLFGRPLRGARSAPLGLLACILSGVLTFMAFPNAGSPEVNLWWMMWFSHIPLLVFLRDKSPLEGLGWGYLCGVIINTGGYYWIADLIQTFGHLPSSIAYLGLSLHSLLVACIWGVWGYLLCALSPRWGVRWVAPLAMVASEHFMPRIFPAYMGDCQFPFLSVMQVSDLFGISAVSFILYRVNAEGAEWVRLGWVHWSARNSSSPKEALPPRPWRGLTITCVIFFSALLYGMIRIPQIDAQIAEAPKLKIGVVEADVGIFQSEPRQKRRDHLLILQRLSQQLVERGAELIIWSESAYRATSYHLDTQRIAPSDLPLVERYQEDLKRKTPRRDRTAPQRGFKVPLLFGGSGIKKSPDGKRWLHYNSAWLLDSEGVVLGRYDKIFRLVFGEYIPFGEVFPQFYDWIPAAGRLEEGVEVKSLELPRPDGRVARLGILICYEGILPSFSRDVVATDPDVLINLTNDDWFGLSAERYLHFVLALPRAIESRRAFVRSTLTGVSAIVDPVGRIVEWTRPEGEETLLREVPLMRPWTLYMVIGDLLPLSCLLLIGYALYRRHTLEVES